VDIGEVREVVRKHCGSDVPCGSGAAAMSWYESGSGADELINTHDLSRCGGLSKVVLVPFVASWFAMGFAISAAWASRRGHMCKLLWNESSSSHQLEPGEGDVTVCLMKCLKVVLFSVQ